MSMEVGSLRSIKILLYVYGSRQLSIRIELILESIHETTIAQGRNVHIFKAHVRTLIIVCD